MSASLSPVISPRKSSESSSQDCYDIGLPSCPTASRSTFASPEVSTKASPSFIPPRPSQPYAPIPSGSSRLSRALNTSHASNLPSIMDYPHDEIQPVVPNEAVEGGGGRKLKRLSLLSKPLLSPIIPSEGSSKGSSDFLRGSAGELEESYTEVDGPSTPRAALVAVGKARGRGKGIRSSISYASSPTTSLRSPAQISGRAEGDRDRAGWGTENRGSGSGSAGQRRSDVQGRGGAGLGLGVLHEDEGDLTPRSRDLRRGEEEAGPGPGRMEGRSSRDAKGVTLAEKHADLLTLIAQKERRVNELKLELAQQELALNQLKQKWTTIATRTTRPFTTQSSSSASSSTSTSAQPSTSSRIAPNQNHHRRSDRPRPLTQSSTASSSSISSNRALSPTSPTSPSDPYSPHRLGPEDPDPGAIIGPDVQAVFNNLLATAYGPEGVVTPSAVEGGKRFWGQLVKTVSAAAAGNVPGSGGATAENPPEGEARSGMDVSALKNIVSLPGWSSIVANPSSTSTSRPIRQPANAHRLPRHRESSTASSSSADASIHSPGLHTPMLGVSDRDRLESLSVGGTGAASAMSSFQDLMDLQDDPSGSAAVVLVGEKQKGNLAGTGPSEQAEKGDEESEDEWGW